MTNVFREALHRNELVVGAWIQIPHPSVAEIFAAAGFDWICVDIEHGSIGLESMANLFRAIENGGSTPVARLPDNDRVWIKRSLDAGAQGLIIPMVNSAEEAERAVSQANYPPRGERGFGYSRANMYGMDFDSYIRKANNDIAMIMQIEHREGINQLEDIVRVQGVDGVFIGPLDLSGSYGKTGELECKEMQKALEKYLTVCRDEGIPAGMHIVRPDLESITKAVEEGYRLLVLGLDVVFLDEGAKESLSILNNEG